MLVFKFGGASVKDAAGIINLGKIVQQYAGEQLLIVVSAMGKTTNALESITKAYIEQTEDTQLIYTQLKDYHYHILQELFEPGHTIFDDVENTFVEIDWMIEDEPHDDADFIYDQLVSIGELVSSRIVNAYLNKVGVLSKWLDVRGYIHTDNTYQEGVVDWTKTQDHIQQDVPGLLKNGVVVTQGFLGGTSENFTTTLGREGSDYTAAIFAACLGAESVTTWKDVPGILNADPKLFADTIKFDQLSYTEAIEMTYYGAGVIHPKTIKPLQNAHIPLLVKPFNDPAARGTVISEAGAARYEKPIIIVKPDQVLISISAKDYSFITESHLSKVFAFFAHYNLRTNMIQVSALSFTVCFNYHSAKFEKLLEQLKQEFNVKYNQQLTLITLRHYQQSDLQNLIGDQKVLLEQISRSTAQIVVKP